LTDLPLWRREGAQPDACRVKVVRDVPYCIGPERDQRRHQLDLFLPEGKTEFPVVVLIHGGAWMMGDNRCCGLYSSVAEFLAAEGIGVVLPNYRLSPGVRHPEHVKDVARAVAWTHAHIGDFGGCPERIFLVGHSAGGHLVSLLASDPRYLHSVGLRIADIKGVIAVSGVYRVPPGKEAVAIGGASPLGFSLDEVAPLRGAGGWGWSRRLGLSGVPVRVDVYRLAFGDDPQVRADASPINHVKPGLPPFLILSAEHDLPTLLAMAVEFQQALSAQGCDAQFLEIGQRNHNSILFKAIEPHDLVASAILDFIRRHSPDVDEP
jgi:acetyl esterase/lipase